jgi:hypothetical protein
MIGATTMTKRAMCAAAATASFFFTVSMFYFAFHRENLRAAGFAVLAIVTALLARRLIKQGIGVTFSALTIGVTAGMVVVTTVFPYRETAAAWGLTPETLPAQIVFGVLYPLGTFLGVFGATYVWPPSRLFLPRQRKPSEKH